MVTFSFAHVNAAGAFIFGPIDMSPAEVGLQAHSLRAAALGSDLAMIWAGETPGGSTKLSAALIHSDGSVPGIAELDIEGTIEGVPSITASAAGDRLLVAWAEGPAGGPSRIRIGRLSCAGP